MDKVVAIPELVDHILQFLSEDDLVQCFLVSKKWSALAVWILRKRCNKTISGYTGLTTNIIKGQIKRIKLHLDLPNSAPGLFNRTIIDPSYHQAILSENNSSADDEDPNNNFMEITENNEVNGNHRNDFNRNRRNTNFEALQHELMDQDVVV